MKRQNMAKMILGVFLLASVLYVVPDAAFVAQAATASRTVYAADVSGNSVSNEVGVFNVSGVTVTVNTSKDTLEACAGIAEGQYGEVQIDNTVGPEARNLIDSVADGIGGKVASVMEITLNVKYANGAPAGTVDELKTPISFVVDTPDNIDGSQNDFVVIRIHNGKADILPDTDSSAQTITFSTDKFSAYAIVYGEKGSLNKYKNGASNVNASGNAGRSPKTADGHLSLWVCVGVVLAGVLLSVTAFIGINRVNKGRNR